MLTERLSRDIYEQTIPHAIIFEGETGTGRHTIIQNTVASLSCKNKTVDSAIPCGKCSSCNKIFGNKSPDIISVGVPDEKATIGIDSIRFLKSDIYIEPNDLDKKIYIIEDADKLTIQAQNAFLLSLEEPPSYVIFFLICKNSSSLLDTVKSRAPVLRTEKIPFDKIKAYLLSSNQQAQKLYQSSPEEFDEIVAASNGSIGKAIRLLDTKERKKMLSDREVAKDFLSLILSRQPAKVFETVSLLGTKRQDICERLTLIQSAIRDLVLLKKSEAPELVFFTNIDYAAELSTHFPLVAQTA